MSHLHNHNDHHHAPYCKHSYIGAPVKAVVHACEYCGHHGKHEGCDCGCHKHGGDGVCSVVVDDANNRIYLYGNIVHENYHVPGGQCVAYAAVESAGFTAPSRLGKDEFFEGVQDQNIITLEQEPIVDNTLMVFLNGLKQKEGAENDYTVNGRYIHFNFYELLPTDRIEVMYTFGGK